MPDIQPYGRSGGLSPRDARRTNRIESRYSAHARSDIAGIDGATDVALGKIDAVGMTVASALMSVTRVAQAQAQLELLAPAASGRLNVLADDHAMAMLELCAEHRRAIRRFS